MLNVFNSYFDMTDFPLRPAMSVQGVHPSVTLEIHYINTHA